MLDATQSYSRDETIVWPPTLHAQAGTQCVYTHRRHIKRTRCFSNRLNPILGNRFALCLHAVHTTRCGDFEQTLTCTRDVRRGGWARVVPRNAPRDPSPTPVSHSRHRAR
jgi:hypothetical protein